MHKNTLTDKNRLFCNILSLTAIIWIFLGFFLLAPQAARADGEPFLFSGPSYADLNTRSLADWIGSLKTTDSPGKITLLDPIPGALVPTDAAPPIIRWKDDAAKTWLISLSADGRPVCQGIQDEPFWIPGPQAWAHIRAAVGNKPIEVKISGISGWTQRDVISSGVTTFAVSPDPVNARLSFIRKNLPFRKALENPYDGQMLVGDPASSGKPWIVMQDQPVCFNCHAYSRDGSSYGMDMDYKGDKGGYVLIDVEETVAIKDGDVISWNAYTPPKPAKYSMGLFTALSPDGRYAISTVGETSAFVMLDDISFSQMFYPATGQIALYDRKNNTVFPLEGANDLGHVQTNPAFSADGKRVAFARANVDPALVKTITDGKLKAEDPAQTIDEVNRKYPVQFDLYSVPFNNGKGGTPTPIPGASSNGMSNFFPKYSPDGRWLVFTQSQTGLVLQPDSKLSIVPAEGGQARLLKGNTGLMNSWHSWSPNSRWIAFSSKGNSPFTEIYLSHIDENGKSSPALRLFRFSSPDLAAMVPEFLPKHGNRLKSMELADPEGAKGESMATDGR